MPTYAETAAARERAARRARQDARDAARERAFDLSAQDTHMKYERASFAVVGEGTKAAQDAYRQGWERIFAKPPVRKPA